ncbi:unnamed protein product [Brachionus calyciflorus]|uniref:Uncharacterized protein n=1 Tax=Brachionus calyciflorus TaxID=104777 RepID=A0A814CTY8_9BILA|nr:unnamed protein product [Brachionus calyciflorus]
MENIDIKKIAEITLDLMHQMDVQDPSIINLEKHSNNFWFIIASKYFKDTYFKKALNLYSWFDCDTFGFKSLLLKLRDSETKNHSDYFKIFFNNNEWLVAKNYISGQTKRLRFLRKFDVMLSLKIRELKINCSLRSINNYFKKHQSQKSDCPFWRGNYKCIFENCGKFKIWIQEKPNDNEKIQVEFMITKKLISHGPIVETEQIRGKERVSLAKEILSEGLEAVRSRNVIERICLDNNNVKPLSNDVLSKIKNEYVHRNRISNDIFVDALATKQIYSNVAISLKTGKISGFLQEINMDPFGVLFVSEIQVIKINDNLNLKNEQLKYSLEILRKEMISNNLNKLLIDENQTPFQSQKENEVDVINDANIFDDLREFKKNLKENSPFSEYYKNLINEFKITGFISKNCDSFEGPNDFYCPGLFEVISKRLYLMPLWSGVIISQLKLRHNEIINRLTNNPIENWFGNLKNNVLKNEKVNTSELASFLYSRLTAKYFEYYYSEEIFDEENKTKKLKEIREMWGENKNAKIWREKENLEFTAIFLNENELTEKGLHFGELEKLRIFFNELSDSKNINELNVLFKRHENMLNFLKKRLVESNLKIYLNQMIDQSFNELLEANNLKEFKPIYNSRNGNCLYNSLSFYYYGFEDYFFVFKIASIYALISNRAFFTALMKDLDYEESLDQMILKTCKTNEWANQLNIQSISIFI